MKSKTIGFAAATIAVAAAALFLLDREVGLTGGHSGAVDSLIARNVAARGGADAWREVTSLRLEGLMDLGQDMHVPYTLEQQRPGRMCLEFEFDDEMASQCVADGAGWQLLPYRGRRLPEPIPADEMHALSDTASIDGLLFDSVERGHEIVIAGRETHNGGETIKLEVTLPHGSKRWVYLDAESGLEVRVDATRMLRGEEHLVETWYSDWRETDGLLIPRRQVTRTEGLAESNFLTIERVTVNPEIAAERFLNPATVQASSTSNGSGSS